MGSIVSFHSYRGGIRCGERVSLKCTYAHLARYLQCVAVQYQRDIIGLDGQRVNNFSEFHITRDRIDHPGKQVCTPRRKEVRRFGESTQK